MASTTPPVAPVEENKELPEKDTQENVGEPEEQKAADTPSVEETSNKEPAEAPSVEGTSNKEPAEAPSVEGTSNKELGGAEQPTEEKSVEEIAATGPVEENMPSFKEESYFEKDLKESERRALQEFSERVEVAIKNGEFVLPPKVEVVKEVTEAAKIGEDTVAVVKTMEKEVKEGGLEVKTEEIAAVVIVPVEPSAAEEKTEEAPEEKTVVSEEKTAAPEEKPVVSEEKTTAPEEKPVVSEEKAAGTVLEQEKAVPEKEKATVPEEEKKESVLEEVPEGKPEERPSETAEVKTDAVIPPAVIEEAQAMSPDVPVVIETTEVIVEDKDHTPPEELELWGVPLLPSKGDPRTQVIFLKFLRAREFRVKEAFLMLKNCILWRKRYGADRILEEDLGTEFDSSAFNHGVDREGHPVQYNVFGVFADKEFYQKVFSDPSKTEKALRWRVQLLEKQIQLLNFNPGGVNSILQVVDLKNAPLLGKVRVFMTQALNLLLDNYPELVVKIVFLNTPWYFNAIYTFMTPFLTARMKSKITFATSLFKFISPDNIPVHYGGLSRANDTDFGDANASVTELVLKAGEKKTADIEISSAGDTVIWEVALIGTDVTYSVEFVPSKEAGYTSIIEKPKRITTLEEPIRNTYKSTEPGKLVLNIDNSGSRKKKTALYRYITKSQA